MADIDAAGLFNRAARHAAAFRQRAPALPQAPQLDYGGMLKLFASALPEQGAAGEQIIDEMVAKGSQGLQMAAGPRFFGWVIGGSHPAGVAADMMVAAWGQNTGNHHAAPAAAAVEAVAAGWLLELLGLPPECSVGFVTGATVANFVCLAAARGEVLQRAGWDADRDGLFGAPPVTVVVGDDAHTTVFSALQFLGLGHDRVKRVATDAQGQIIPEKFSAALAEVSGPLIVILQAGQLNTGGFDPFASLIPLAHAKGAWVHVDGAFGLWAQAAPHRRQLSAGVEQADSWATDGHKWLQTPYDCGYAIVRHELAHRRAMTIAASYLPLAAEGERDPSHYVPELSRRARGFPTWAIIKALGRTGIEEMVERHCRFAALMAGRLAQEPGIAVVNDVVLNQAIVRFADDDGITRATIARIQQDGVCFAGGALWRGRQVMRLSVIGGSMTEEDVHVSAEAIIGAYRNVRQQT